VEQNRIQDRRALHDPPQPGLVAERLRAQIPGQRAHPLVGETAVVPWVGGPTAGEKLTGQQAVQYRIGRPAGPAPFQAGPSAGGKRRIDVGDRHSSQVSSL
jgi:hypothetical protein